MMNCEWESYRRQILRTPCRELQIRYRSLLYVFLKMLYCDQTRVIQWIIEIIAERQNFVFVAHQNARVPRIFCIQKEDCSRRRIVRG